MNLQVICCNCHAQKTVQEKLHIVQFKKNAAYATSHVCYSCGQVDGVCGPDCKKVQVVRLPRMGVEKGEAAKHMDTLVAQARDRMGYTMVCSKDGMLLEDWFTQFNYGSDAAAQRGCDR